MLFLSLKIGHDFARGVQVSILYTPGRNVDNSVYLPSPTRAGTADVE